MNKLARKPLSLRISDIRRITMTTKRTSTTHTVSASFRFAASLGWPRALCSMLLLLAVLAAPGCRKSAPPTEPNKSTEPNKPVVSPNEPNEQAQALPDEINLFDGQTLGQWESVDFGGQGEVAVKDGAVYMEMGNDMTGIVWKGPVFRTNYEITLDAKRVKGNDFFCGLTFPVGDNPCSLILGGWGGELCGLSNIDYYDAANNETTQLISFEMDRWYHVRLKVTPTKIQAWLDDNAEPLVDVEIAGRKIDIRAEMDLCRPLGIATWQTGGAVRNMRMKKLAD